MTESKIKKAGALAFSVKKNLRGEFPIYFLYMMLQQYHMR